MHGECAVWLFRKIPPMERDKPMKYDVLQVRCLELVTVHNQTCTAYSARNREECKVWIFRQIPPIWSWYTAGIVLRTPSKVFLIIDRSLPELYIIIGREQPNFHLACHGRVECEVSIFMRIRLMEAELQPKRYYVPQSALIIKALFISPQWCTQL
jgi:hypothetical protein